MVAKKQCDLFACLHVHEAKTLFAVCKQGPSIGAERIDSGPELVPAAVDITATEVGQLFTGFRVVNSNPLATKNRYFSAIGAKVTALRGVGPVGTTENSLTVTGNCVTSVMCVMAA
jgi:hypothetical protein